MSDETDPNNPMTKARAHDRSPLPKRFYAAADVAPADAEADCRDGFVVRLDARPVRTPKRRRLVLPERGLADAIAQEWNDVADVIDPAAMPLTRLANTALDGVAETREAVAADAVRFVEADLICYRAEEPEGLIARQNAAWDPLVDWARDTMGIRLNLAAGIVHVAQPPESLDRARAHVDGLDVFALTGLHVMTTVTGSFVLALAVAHGRLSVEDAWAASLVDEDWQIGQWGADEEAMRRRGAKWLEMQAAARMTRRGGGS